jgi:hypothetical protein
VSALLPGLVAATISTYNTLRAELLPTPAKSHYTFNLRDLSKVFQVRLGSVLHPLPALHTRSSHRTNKMPQPDNHPPP